MRNQLVFVEGLWHTGKSHLVQHINETKTPKDNIAVVDNLRNLGTVRHGAYIIYPSLIKNKNHIYDRSPVTMKVISDPQLGLYCNDLISANYWVKYYEEWLKLLQESDYKVTFIYFRPFEQNTYKFQTPILNFVKAYNKTQLLIDNRNLTEDTLIKIHEMFLNRISTLYKHLKSRFDFYQVEYRDEEEALNVLRYEKFMLSLGVYNDNN
jgi:hypothetical protein